MRRLRPVPAVETAEALRAALAGGDAILPLAPGAEPPADLPEHVPQRVALVVETSGSSGRPKRVALTADALLASASASAAAVGGAGRWLLALPTHYIAGVNVLVRSLAAGMTPVVLEGRFEAQRFAAAARELDVVDRYTALVPTQLARIVSAEDPSVIEEARSFAAILVGGQALPEPVLTAALELGLTVVTTYGSSETSGGCVYDGVPIGDTRVRVVDGRIEIAGSVLAEGYLDEELMRERFVVDDGRRWYRTGDVGAIEDGRLRVEGRADDVIVSGGVKVSLAAVERVVRGVPGLAEAVVVAADDAEWGQVPVVVSVQPADLAGLRARVARELGVAARPARIVELAALPMLASGKPDRRAIGTLVASSAGGDARPTAQA